MNKLNQIHKAQAIWACIFALGLSFSIVAGWLYDETSFLALTPISAVVFVVLFLVLCVPFYLLFARTTCGHDTQSNSSEAKHAKTKTWQPTRRDIYILIAVIAVPQLILWLIAWPGVYHYDAPFHILQINPTYNEAGPDLVPLGNKYSVLFSLFLGGGVKLSLLQGNTEIGFAAVMFLQAAIVIYAQVKAAIFIGRQSCSKVFYWVATWFFALHPFIMIMRISSCQDTLFAAFMLLAIIEAFKMGQFICAPSNASAKFPIKSASSFAIFVVLMCLMRNNGLYLYAFAFVLMLPLLLKRRQFKATGFFIVPIVVVMVITGPVYKACGVVESNTAIQEMSSVPSQQLARSYADNPDSYTQEDVDTFNKFYPGITEDVSWYWEYSEVSDVSKGKLNSDAIKSDVLGYAKFYFQMGLKNADSYRDAFLMNTLGWWYPMKKYQDPRMYHPYIHYDSVVQLSYEGTLIPIERTGVAPVLDNFIKRAVMSGWWSRIPVVNLLFNTGTYTWIFLLLCAIAALNKRRDACFALLIIGGLLLTYLLSPLCIFRYSFAMITCIPVLALVCFKGSVQREAAYCGSGGSGRQAATGSVRDAAGGESLRATGSGSGAADDELK